MDSILDVERRSVAARAAIQRVGIAPGTTTCFESGVWEVTPDGIGRYRPLSDDEAQARGLRLVEVTTSGDRIFERCDPEASTDTPRRTIGTPLYALPGHPDPEASDK